MMTIKELMACIQKLSPGAKVTVMQVSADSDPYAVYAPSHTGPKPTLEECEAVLSEVRAEIAAERAAKDKEGMVDTEMQQILREQAIDRLVKKGTLTQSDKEKMLGIVMEDKG